MVTSEFVRTGTLDIKKSFSPLMLNPLRALICILFSTAILGDMSVLLKISLTAVGGCVWYNNDDIPSKPIVPNNCS